MGDDQDTRPDDIMAPPRQPPRKPTAATSASAMTAPPDDAVSDGTAIDGRPAGGAPANGNGIETAKDAPSDGGKDLSANGTSKDTSRTAVADDTIVDGVPALPADTIAGRASRAKEPEPDRQAPSGQVGEPSPADDSPAHRFGPRPSASVWASAGGQATAGPAESAAKPSGDDRSPAASSGTMPSGRSSSASPGTAEAPSVSPAAFAWEMPDPPPHSPSSPARTFLRSGAAAKSPAAPKTAPSAGPSAGPSARPGQAAAAAQSPVTVRSGTQKQKAQKAQSKRTARQAHLTIARVEPWSVMKFSFVVSLVAFVILFVAVSVLYAVLNGLGVFDSIQHVVSSVTSSQTSTGVNAKAWFSASRILGYTAVLGLADIVLITAMSTIGAVVYNLTSRLVGGVEVTLRETE